MALTFPLTLANFLDRLSVALMEFDLGEAMQVDETGRGEVLTASMGARLWQGQVDLAPRNFGADAPQSALIQAIRDPGRPFLMTDLSRPGPTADPAGVILGSATPVLAATQAGGRQVQLTGLPAAYVLTPGDRFAFDYGSSPTRRALHEIVTGGVASGSGVSPWAEVVPTVRAGWTGTPAVTMLRPACKAVILPGTARAARMLRNRAEGMSFRFIQTLG